MLRTKIYTFHGRCDPMFFHKAESSGSLKERIASLDYDLIGSSEEQVRAWWESHKALDKKKLKERG